MVWKLIYTTLTTAVIVGPNIGENGPSNIINKADKN
jgi:hypothetical protein